MSVLVYAENDNGTFKKTAQEVVSYAKGVADMTGGDVIAVTFNAPDAASLGNYGATQVVNVNDSSLDKFVAAGYAQAIAAIAQEKGAHTVILSSSADSRYLGGLLAVHMDAGYVANVTALPESASPFTVKHTVFTNKAYAHTAIETDKRIIGLAKNSYGVHETGGTASVSTATPSVDAGGVTVESVDVATGTVSIADAEIVVSGGRGLKGPENWHLIENLAEVLGAATACSKPVSDMGWRPHSEHVGQTGKPVASTLYIAVGVSGAIQHLAGVNSSKVKVVINNDPEAPFFKAADYGIVGDAFEIVPQLTEKLKAFKAANA